MNIEKIILVNTDGSRHNLEIIPERDSDNYVVDACHHFTRNKLVGNEEPYVLLLNVEGDDCKAVIDDSDLGEYVIAEAVKTMFIRPLPAYLHEELSIAKLNYDEAVKENQELVSKMVGALDEDLVDEKDCWDNCSIGERTAVLFNIMRDEGCKYRFERDTNQHDVHGTWEKNQDSWWCRSFGRNPEFQASGNLSDSPEDEKEQHHSHTRPGGHR